MATFIELVNDCLSGQSKINALNFAEYLEANGMITENSEIRYNGEIIGYFHVDGAENEPGPWTVWSSTTDGLAAENW